MELVTRNRFKALFYVCKVCWLALALVHRTNNNKEIVILIKWVNRNIIVDPNKCFSGSANNPRWWSTACYIHLVVYRLFKWFEIKIPIL